MTREVNEHIWIDLDVIILVNDYDDKYSAEDMEEIFKSAFVDIVICLCIMKNTTDIIVLQKASLYLFVFVGLYRCC